MTSQVTELPSRGAGRREWIGLGVLALPALLISLDFSVLTLAVPKISEALHPSANQLLWMIDIYGFMLAGFLVTMGSVGDLIGRRRLLLLGGAGFGFASTLAAFSTNPSMLIAARAILGVAGATLLPSSMALISVMFDEGRQRVLAIAIWSTALPVGGAIGPIVGGAILNWYWWGAAFLIGVPVMIVLLVIGPVLLPEFRDPNATRPDLSDVGLSLAAVLPIVYGAQLLATHGSSGEGLGALIVGLGCAVWFVVRQRKSANPLVDVRLFRSLGFSTSLAANFFSYFVILGMLMLYAQFLQLVLGLSTLRAGLWTVPAMIGLIGGSLLTPLLVKKVRPSVVMSAGFSVAAVGFVVLARSSVTDGLGLAVSGAAIFCLGLAPVTTLVINVVLGTAPHERAGAASGLSETTTELGGALGIAVLGTIATVVYQAHLVSHLPPQLSDSSRNAIKASLGGAASAVSHLGPGIRDAVYSEAQHAFRDGLRAASIVSAAVSLVLAVTTVAVLRRAPIEEDSEPEGNGLLRRVDDEPGAGTDRQSVKIGDAS